MESIAPNQKRFVLESPGYKPVILCFLTHVISGVFCIVDLIC